MALIKRQLKKLLNHLGILDKLYVFFHGGETRCSVYNLCKKIKTFRKRNKIYLVLTPTHNNLGDSAIAESEIRLLTALKINYLEITDKELLLLQQYKKLSIMNGGTIIINGGGNLGTLWFNVEQLIRAIIIHNPKSKIYIMPSTIYYENSDWGCREFNNSIKIYNGHKNLKIYAREKISYSIMYKAYNNVELMPDMVLFLNENLKNWRRKGCLLCLRTDKERTLEEDDKALLISKLNTVFDNLIFTDMYATEQYVSVSERKDELEKKLNEFRKCQLVVTDRLHGMIFATITGTPCIVVNSKSPKLKGCYDWLKDLKYIKFCDDVYQIENIYSEIKGINPVYDNKKLMPYYDKLSEDLKKLKQDV